MKNVNLSDEQILSLKALCFIAANSKEVKFGQIYMHGIAFGKPQKIPFEDALCNVADMIEEAEADAEH